MCWIKFDRIRSLNACRTYRKWPSLRISPSFCCSPEVNIAKNWIWLFAFVLQWCNFSQQCLYIVVIISFVLLKYFLCPYDRLTAPYPLDLFCRSCMYLVWALQRLDPTYLMLLLKLLVCSDDGCKLSNKWWEVQNLKFKGNMSNIYIFFGQLSQLCELCLHRCHVYCTAGLAGPIILSMFQCPRFCGTHCFI